MSVLIKGIKMPGKCDSCNVNKCFLWYDYDDSSCRRHPDCPLIEVPEPHGRLIDADALIKSLNELCGRICWYPKGQREIMCSACPLGSAFTAVEDGAPTVIPASEVET